MNSLMVIEPATAGCLSVSEIADVMDFAAAEKAPATVQAYRSDFADFAAWVTFPGGCPLPAQPAMICGYLSALAKRGRKASTIGRRLAAIADAHRRAGIDPVPTAHEGVKTTLRGIRRIIGTACEQKAPITAEVLTGMLKHVPDSMIGKRDRALLTFGFAAAMRRSELVALQVEDLTEVADGYLVTIRRSKTDQSGEGQTIAVPRGFRLRPVEAVQTWLAAAEINAGPVFRAVARGGKVSDTALTDDSMARVLKRYAHRAGLDPALYSGHSLRSGYVTSCVEANAPLLKVVEVTRHKSLDMLRVYSRRADLFREHSGAAFL